MKFQCCCQKEAGHKYHNTELFQKHSTYWNHRTFQQKFNPGTKIGIFFYKEQ